MSSESTIIPASVASTVKRAPSVSPERTSESLSRNRPKSEERLVDDHILLGDSNTASIASQAKLSSASEHDITGQEQHNHNHIKYNGEAGHRGRTHTGSGMYSDRREEPWHFNSDGRDHYDNAPSDRHHHGSSNRYGSNRYSRNSFPSDRHIASGGRGMHYQHRVFERGVPPVERWVPEGSRSPFHHRRRLSESYGMESHKRNPADMEPHFDIVRPHHPPTLMRRGPVIHGGSGDQQEVKFFERPIDAIRLSCALVLREIVPLGDSLLDISNRITFLSQRLSSRVICLNLDPRLFSTVSTQNAEFVLPGDLKNNSNVSANIDAISEAIAEVALHLPTKSSIYAALVALWNHDDSRLAEGISKIDFETLNVKAATEDEEDLERRTRIEVAKMKWFLSNCLVKAVVEAVQTRIDTAFTRGCMCEAKAGLRFLCDLANCSVIDPIQLTSLIKQLADMAQEAPIIYSNAIIEHVISVLPWLTYESYEKCKVVISELLSPIEEYINSKSSICDHETEELLQAVRMSEGCHAHSLYSMKWPSFQNFQRDWRSRSFARVYLASGLTPLILPHAASVSHNIRGFNFSAKSLLQGMSVLHTAALRIFTIGASDTPLDLPIPISLDEQISGSQSSCYDRTASMMGIGGGSVGLNGVWPCRGYVMIFTQNILIRLLNGVKPLDSHDRWILEELILAAMHAFRHTVHLCAEVVLKIPSQHDQFEIVLIETVFNEMLRIPHPSESLLFYFRLISVMCQRQETLIRLIPIALDSLARRCNTWDPHTLDVLASFFSFWLSVLPNGPDSFDFSIWAPETITAERHLWVEEGHRWETPPMEISLDDDRLSEIHQQLLPIHLKEFLISSFDRLSRILWPGSFIERLPSWLVPYVPISQNGGCLSNFNFPQCQLLANYELYIASQTEPNQLRPQDATSTAATEYHANLISASSSFGEDKDKIAISAATMEAPLEETTWVAPVGYPLEYILFRRLFLSRFTSAQHRDVSISRILEVITHKLLGFPHLAALPSNEFIHSVIAFETPIVPNSNLGSTSENLVSEDIAVGTGEDTTEASVNTNTGGQNTNSSEPATIHDVKQESVLSEPDTNDAATGRDDVTMEDKVELPSIKVEPLLDEEFIYQEESGTMTTWNLVALIEVFMRALLAHGLKTLTHTQRAIENYGTLLLALSPKALTNQASNNSLSENALKAATSTADIEYFHSILRCVFDFWSVGPLRWQWTLEVLTKGEIIPVVMIQNFMLNNFSLPQICQRTTQESFMYFVHHTARLAALAEENARRMKRAAMDITDEKQSEFIVDENTLRYKEEIQNLFLDYISSTHKRILIEEQDSNLDIEEGYINAEAFIVHEAKKTLTSTITAYCRTFIHLIENATFCSQTFGESFAHEIESLKRLKVYLHPELY